jgi:hypothetical protein
MVDAKIIEALGGTCAVARLCEVRSPSVSDWKKHGIPRARLMYLRLLRPDLFADGQAQPLERPARERQTPKEAV